MIMFLKRNVQTHYLKLLIDLYIVLLMLIVIEAVHEKEWQYCLLPRGCLCDVSLPRGVVGRAVNCNCVISWSYSLIIYCRFAKCLKDSFFVRLLVLIAVNYVEKQTGISF